MSVVSGLAGVSGFVGSSISFILFELYQYLLYITKMLQTVVRRVYNQLVNIKAVPSQLKKFVEKRFKTLPRAAIIFLVVLIAALLIYFTKGLFVAALVNGRPIFRLSLIQELEKQSGQKALDSLITQTLILQEANKQKVNVSDQDVNQALKDLEDNITQQGGNLDQLLAVQGMTREDLKQQIKLQKIVEKIVGKDVTVSDEETDEYIKNNQSQLPEGETTEQLRAEVKEQLRQQKISEKITVWVEDLRAKANINYFVQF